MTVILFLIDTSASMNQKTYIAGRSTLLDVAKGAVEIFIRMRQKNPDSRSDRFMLLTFEDPPHNIKVGWKMSNNIDYAFWNELKKIQCNGLTTMGVALKHALDLLNINRWQTGIDTYGQGRCPYLLESSIILLITDGGKVSSSLGVHSEFHLPMNLSAAGAELIKEPFHWDQRLFSLVLRLRGTPAPDREPGLVSSDRRSPINAMCEVTGGRSYRVTTYRILLQCLESLVQKLQPGVIVNFELAGPKVDNSLTIDANGDVIPLPWNSCRKMIYMPKAQGRCFGNWPIPESFWADKDTILLPSRTAHPVVKFRCIDQVPLVIDNLPFDKYEMEPSPLTLLILEKRNPNVCWQIFIENSTKAGEPDAPFGYLKANTKLTGVNMFVLPFNYPVVVPLLKELVTIHKFCPDTVWKNQFESYLRTMPLYYALHLKKALEKMGASAKIANLLIPEHMENSISELVFNHLQRVKQQSKIEHNRLYSDTSSKSNKIKERAKVLPRSYVDKSLTSHPRLKKTYKALQDKIHDFNGYSVGLTQTKPKTVCSFKNPFDISRNVLVDQVQRMRTNFLRTSLSQTQVVDTDLLHCVPVGQMSNYNENTKKMVAPLRELENTVVRTNYFGNPFKADKRVIVDEADIDFISTSSKNLRRAVTPESTIRSRKIGPLPKDYKFKKSEPASATMPAELNDVQHAENSADAFRTQLSPFNYMPDVGDSLVTLTGNNVTNQEQEILADLQADAVEVESKNSGPDEVPQIRSKKSSKKVSKMIEIKNHNMDVRKKVFKEIRKPGRNFKPLFDHLDELHGNVDMRTVVLEEIIKETNRFKRQVLANMLKEFLKRMQKGHRPKFEDVKYLMKQ